MNIKKKTEDAIVFSDLLREHSAPGIVKHYDREYVVTAKFKATQKKDANLYLETKKDEGVICVKDGFVYIAKISDEGIPTNSKIHFSEVSEGKKKIISLYAKEEVSSGEFADYLVKHISNMFESSMPLSLIIGAIQAFRVWDNEDKNEVLAKVAMIHIEENGFGDEAYWDNTFQDYIYHDRSFVPKGTRIGIRTNNSLVLDEGIFVSKSPRRKELEVATSMEEE